MGQVLKDSEASVFTISEGNPFDNDQMKSALNALKRQLSNPQPQKVILPQQQPSAPIQKPAAPQY